MVTTTTLDRTEGIARLNTALQVIRESIEESDGLFNIKMEVRFLSFHVITKFVIYCPKLLVHVCLSDLETLFLEWSRILLVCFAPCIQPKVVTDVDDEELRTQMEELRLMNQEVGGDDDQSDDNEGIEAGDGEQTPDTL